MHPKSALGLAAASLALAVISLVAAKGEISPYITVGMSPELRFQAISSGSYHAGQSFASKEMLLRDCVEVADSIYAKAQPTPKRNAFLQSCGAEAESMIRDMPGYARAWLVEALVSVEQGRSDDFLQALRQSQRTAPGVHWLADQRSRLAEEHFALLSPDDVTAYERDIRTLLDGTEGLRAVAQRYTKSPELRERLTDIVAAAPQDIQARFLAEVRARAGG